MDFGRNDRRGGRSVWAPRGLMAASALALTIFGTGQANASDWAFQQFERANSQQLTFSDSTGRVTRTYETRRGARQTRSKRSTTYTRVASRGDTRRDFYDEGQSYSRSTRRSLSGGGGITWQANAGCLTGSLRGLVASVASNFGPVRVTSTCRSHGHNRSVGGAPNSHHLTGNAVDFRVMGASPGAVMAYLRSHGAVGGLKHYGGGLFHVDTGARRSW